MHVIARHTYLSFLTTVAGRLLLFIRVGDKITNRKLQFEMC